MSLTINRTTRPFTELMRDWFVHEGIAVIPWPAKSPNLNIIENVWALLKRYVDDGPRQPQNLAELEKILMEGWSIVVTTKLWESLYGGLPLRFEQVISNNGARIKT